MSKATMKHVGVPFVCAKCGGTKFLAGRGLHLIAAEGAVLRQWDDGIQNANTLSCQTCQTRYQWNEKDQQYVEVQ